MSGPHTLSSTSYSAATSAVSGGHCVRLLKVLPDAGAHIAETKVFFALPRAHHDAGSPSITTALRPSRRW